MPGHLATAATVPASLDASAARSERADRRKGLTSFIGAIRRKSLRGQQPGDGAIDSAARASSQNLGRRNAPPSASMSTTSLPSSRRARKSGAWHVGYADAAAVVVPPLPSPPNHANAGAASGVQVFASRSFTSLPPSYSNVSTAIDDARSPASTYQGTFDAPTYEGSQSQSQSHIHDRRLDSHERKVPELSTSSSSSSVVPPLPIVAAPPLPVTYAKAQLVLPSSRTEPSVASILRNPASNRPRSNSIVKILETDLPPRSTTTGLDAAQTKRSDKAGPSGGGGGVVTSHASAKHPFGEKPPRGTLNSAEKLAYLDWRLAQIYVERISAQERDEMRASRVGGRGHGAPSLSRSNTTSSLRAERVAAAGAARGANRSSQHHHHYRHVDESIPPLPPLPANVHGKSSAADEAGTSATGKPTTSRGGGAQQALLSPGAPPPTTPTLSRSRSAEVLSPSASSTLRRSDSGFHDGDGGGGTTPWAQARKGSFVSVKHPPPPPQHTPALGAAAHSDTAAGAGASLPPPDAPVHAVLRSVRAEAERFGSQPQALADDAAAYLDTTLDARPSSAMATPFDEPTVGYGFDGGGGRGAAKDKSRRSTSRPPEGRRTPASADAAAAPSKRKSMLPAMLRRLSMGRGRGGEEEEAATAAAAALRAEAASSRRGSTVSRAASLTSRRPSHGGGGGSRRSTSSARWARDADSRPPLPPPAPPPLPTSAAAAAANPLYDRETFGAAARRAADEVGLELSEADIAAQYLRYRERALKRRAEFDAREEARRRRRQSTAERRASRAATLRREPTTSSPSMGRTSRTLSRILVGDFLSQKQKQEQQQQQTQRQQRRGASDGPGRRGVGSGDAKERGDRVDSDDFSGEETSEDDDEEDEEAEVEELESDEDSESASESEDDDDDEEEEEEEEEEYESTQRQQRGRMAKMQRFSVFALSAMGGYAPQTAPRRRR